MTDFLKVGFLLLGPFLALCLVRFFWKHLDEQRAFLFFLTILGFSALASAALGLPLWPTAVGIHITRSWITAFSISTVLGAGFVYLLSRGLFGSPVGQAHPSALGQEVQLVFAAIFVGIVEEYYFRGVWGSLCRDLLGPIPGALLTNTVFVLVLSPWICKTRLLTLLTFYGFGASLSWAVEVTRSLAIPAGIHTACYYVHQRWPRSSQAGRSPRTLAYWLGREDPALGLGPVALYWVAVYLSVVLIRWVP